MAGTANPKTCKATAGRIEVCNSTYGKNGWLGIAQIWLSGGHISQGTVKLNDTYFKTAQYNTTAWRNLVSCQEVGHTFGLDHQDENFSNAEPRHLHGLHQQSREQPAPKRPRLRRCSQLSTRTLDSTTTAGQGQHLGAVEPPRTKVRTIPPSSADRLA